MISVTEARAMIARHTAPLPPRCLPLGEAAGLVLAENVVAHQDIPGYPQSSVDGYAFAFADRASPLEIIGESAAGVKQQQKLGHTHAMRIFTGAPLPTGADTVLMQEDAVIESGFLRIPPKAEEGAYVRAQGAEIEAGALAMKSGKSLNPAAIGFLAGVGIDRVMVYPNPSVTILITGDELIPPGSPLPFGQVYESNSFSLRAALQAAGIRSIEIRRVADTLEATRAAVEQALAHSDCVILSGGVSVGDYDFVTEAVERCHVIQHFHKVKQKPGKPLLFGSRGSALLFGLPGNPASVLTCFYVYVLPALHALAHRTSHPSETLLLDANYRKPAGLAVFLKGQVKEGRAYPLDAQESFRLRSFAEAELLICLPEGRESFEAGEPVEILRLPV